MKFVEPRHFADPAAAARKLVETPDRHDAGDQIGMGIKPTDDGL
jgi:hypothetical protein